MRKFLRFMLIVIAIIAAVIVILGIYEPTDFTIQRSTLIKAPKAVVFEQIVKFKNWTNWSPWYKLDSTMKMTYTGVDGAPGSAYHWVGNEKKTGEGEMIDSTVNGTEMHYVLNFTKPYKSTATGFLKAEDTANNMTKATWSFSMHMSFPWNAMMVFGNMDKMLGGDFEKGLGNMKTYLESAPTSPFAQIGEIQYPAQTVEGIRGTVSWNDMRKFFSDNSGKLGKDIGEGITGNGLGVFYKWDTVNKNTDVMVAFPVTDGAAPVKGATIMQLPASKAYTIKHTGGYASIMSDHKALGDYLASKNEKMNVVVEEYVVGQDKEKDSTKWITNIYYLVQ